MMNQTTLDWQCFGALPVNQKRLSLADTGVLDMELQQPAHCAWLNLTHDAWPTFCLSEGKKYNQALSHNKNVIHGLSQ